MVILTDLSDVLIQGFYGVGEIIATHYGKDVAEACWARHLEVEEVLRELLRGNMSEDEYWHIFLEKDRWPFGIQGIKEIFSESLQETIPGTLKVYQRIIAFPCYTRNPDSMAISGMPEIYLVSDHIAERLDEIHSYHPEIFRVVSKEFWSCEIGRIKTNLDFFPRLLRVIDIKPEEAIFIDDNANNTTSASLSGISSIRFENAKRLEVSLKEYGFQFAPATP